VRYLAGASRLSSSAQLSTTCTTAAGRSVDQLAQKENEVIIGLLRLRASTDNGASGGTAR